MPKDNFATRTKLVKGLPLATDAAGRTSRGVTLKNSTFATVIASITQGNAATVALTILQAQNVAGLNVKPITNPAPIWANLDTDASDTLVRQTDAVSFTTDAAVKNKQVVFHVDPAYFDIANGFDCLLVSTGASNVANLTSIDFLLEGQRYQSEPMPTAIVD